MFTAQKKEIEERLAKRGIADDLFFDWKKWDGKIMDDVIPVAQKGAQMSHDAVMRFTGESGKFDSNAAAVAFGSVESLANVNQTTRRLIEKILLTGSTDLSPVWKTSLQYRAGLIGTNVGTTSTNWGILDGMKSAGIKKKKWVSQHDDDVRQAHAEADGKEVERDAVFIVGGEPLRFPGDPIGSLANIINCRCYITITGE